MFQEIYVLDETAELFDEIVRLFRTDLKFKIYLVKQNELENVLKNIPKLIIINADNIENTDEVYKRIRQNEDNRITPIIVISSDNSLETKIKTIKQEVDYYIEKSWGTEYIFYTIKNIVRLMSVNRTLSPLTGLPGNVQIQAELKKRILKNETFEILYLDLDNFKAYNDVYGFVNGDEIIKFTADVISKNIHTYGGQDSFIGHIGGDDFVVILNNSSMYEKICQNIIAEFDKEIIKFFNQDDLERGYLEVQNRKGVVEEFPITSLSIGVVVADSKRFANILEIGEAGAQVKHLAKTIQGSCYAINRREK